MPETRDLSGARRILLHGVTGSGKTTLAGSPRRSIPWTDIDHLNWRPGWTEVPTDQLLAEVVIVLDYPRWLSFTRLLRRTGASRAHPRAGLPRQRRDLAQGAGPSSILLWHWRAFPRKRVTTEALRTATEGPPVLVLRRPRDADGLLASLRA